MMDVMGFVATVGSVLLGVLTAVRDMILGLLDRYRYTIHSVKRVAGGTITSVRMQKVIDDEQMLRKRVYKAFLRGKFSAQLDRICNDEDMKGEYWVAVVYKKVGMIPFFRKHEPIMSCRYFCGIEDIWPALGCDFAQEWNPPQEPSVKLANFLPEHEATGSVCIDRLSDTTHENSTAKPIGHALIFNRVIRDTKASLCFGIARQGPKEEYLGRYILAGMKIIGVTTKPIGGIGKKYRFWILRGKVKEMRAFVNALAPLPRVAFRGIPR